MTGESQVLDPGRQAGRRRRARQWALQMLFQIDVAAGDPAEVAQLFWRGVRSDAKSRRFAESLVAGVCARRKEIDDWLAGSLEHWRLARVAVVDRNVLRLAVFELLSAPDTPPAVVLDEAIEIAKRFGGGESGGFINGVLDSVRLRLERRPVPVSGAGATRPS